MNNSKRLKSLSVGNLYAKRFAVMPLPEDGVFAQVFNAEIPKGGIWLIHGDEKQGKTTLCLKLSKWLSTTNRVLYVQSEQSSNDTDIDKLFVEAMQRCGISPGDRKLTFFGDISEESLTEILGRKRSPDIVFIDNLTTATWVDTALVRNLSKQFRNKTIVYISHNDRNGDPNGSTGKAIKRLANTIFSVDSLRCDVTSRGDWGGPLNIDWKNGIVMYGKTE